MWIDGLLGMALALRCPWFWDLWNLLLKLMLGLTEAPESREVHLRTLLVGGTNGGGQDPQLWQCCCLLPNLCPASPATHFCRWCIPILNLSIREPSPLHCVETELNIVLMFYSHPMTTVYISHICITWPGCFSCACWTWPPSPHSRSALQPSDTWSAWHISFVPADVQ